MDQVQEVEPVLLKISASKEPGYAKKVASAMLWRLRDCDGYCRARTMREAATNTAIKAVAICNQRVATASCDASDIVLGIDLHFSRPEGVTAIDMLIGDVGKAENESMEFRVSGREDNEALNAKLAEAISNACLDGKRVFLKCIGPSAVYRAVIASTIAKGSLFASGYSSVIIPTWESIPAEDGGKPVSLINIEFRGFLAEQVGSI
jgi:stage V sporulation protein SpoVS